ncbi:MAG: hypothetical protein M1837_006535 [Sclerophora amabilis]|nr:MAG: hypothetical protein M1837_006535 [Sclerophora amabilis]
MSRRHDIPSPLPQLSIKQLAELYASPSSVVPDIDLVEALSEYEADACVLFTDTTVTGDADVLRLFYSGYVFALLLINELNEARFLTHRFPPSLKKSDQTLNRSTNLVRALWSKDYNSIYQTLTTPGWPEELRPLVDRYIAYFRFSTFNLLGRAYTSLPPSLGAMYLGLDGTDDEVTEQFISRGWSFDTAKRTLCPPPVIEEPKSSAATRGTASRGDSAASLVDLVGFLGEESSSSWRL